MNNYRVQIIINGKQNWIEMDFDNNVFSCDSADAIEVLKQIPSDDKWHHWKPLHFSYTEEYKKSLE